MATVEAGLDGVTAVAGLSTFSHGSNAEPIMCFWRKYKRFIV